MPVYSLQFTYLTLHRARNRCIQIINSSNFIGLKCYTNNTRIQNLWGLGGIRFENSMFGFSKFTLKITFLDLNIFIFQFKIWICFHFFKPIIITEKCNSF